MRDRGYDGQLVLAGFHLDRGSSFGHELSGAGRHAEQVIRMGSVSDADKAWLLQTRARPCCIPRRAKALDWCPFEAAALGTPTAFVSFGPLRETLPGVDACAGWQVRRLCRPRVPAARAIPQRRSTRFAPPAQR